MVQKKKILQLALPATAENLLQMLMGIVDNYLVARLGIVAISGVSVANNIITIYQAIFIALGAAISSVIAKSRGEKSTTKQLRYQSQAVFVTLILGGVIGLVSILFGQSFLNLLGTETAVAQSGGRYLAIVGGLIVSLGLMTTLGSILRAQGRAQLPMYVSLLTNLLNAIFSSLSVFVCHWGIAGVAGATVLSRIIGVLLLASQLPIKKMLKNMILTLDDELMRIALPAAGERLMMRAGDVVIVALIVKFGTEVVAGNAIGETLAQFNYMPGLGVATATVILVAHDLGKNNQQEIRQIVHESYIISIVCMGFIAAIIYLLGGRLTTFFTENAAVQQASLVVLFYSLLGSPATAGTLIYTATWQGLGKAKLPFYATTFGMWGIRIGLGFILSLSFRLGLAGVWLATLIDNLFRWQFLRFLYRRKIEKR